MIEFITVTLDQLCGEHVLDAVDTYVETVKEHPYANELIDSNGIRFRLDGAVYTAVENPDDGYRSSMEKIFVTLDIKMKNVFPPIKVVVKKKPNSKYQSNDTLVLIDKQTKKVVLEVGTDNIADYYPSFVAAFFPENMITNAKKTPNKAVKA